MHYYLLHNCGFVGFLSKSGEVRLAPLLPPALPRVSRIVLFFACLEDVAPTLILICPGCKFVQATNYPEVDGTVRSNGFNLVVLTVPSWSRADPSEIQKARFTEARAEKASF
jgi:hypothetical protein